MSPHTQHTTRCWQPQMRHLTSRALVPLHGANKDEDDKDRKASCLFGAMRIVATSHQELNLVTNKMRKRRNCYLTHNEVWVIRSIPLLMQIMLPLTPHTTRSASLVKDETNIATMSPHTQHTTRCWQPQMRHLTSRALVPLHGANKDEDDKMRKASCLFGDEAEDLFSICFPHYHLVRVGVSRRSFGYLLSFSIIYSILL